MGKFGGHIGRSQVSVGADKDTVAARQEAVKAAEQVETQTPSILDLPSEQIAQATPQVATPERATTDPMATSDLTSLFDTQPSLEEREATQLATERIVRPTEPEAFEQELLSVPRGGTQDRSKDPVTKYMDLYGSFTKITDPDDPLYSRYGVSTKVPGGNFEKIGKVASIIRDPAKLGMSLDPKDANSKIDPAFNHALTLATLDVIHALQPSKADVDFDQPQDAEVEDDNTVSTNGNAIASRIGNTVEKMLYPSQGVDAQGRTVDFGYRGKLSDEDKQVLGSAVVGSLTEMGILQKKENFDTSGKKQIDYVTTPLAIERLGVTAPIVNKMLGNYKPVSLVPLGKGKYVGEAAYQQKQVTRTPLPTAARKSLKATTSLTSVKGIPILQESINIMGSTGNAVVELNKTIVQTMFADVQRVGSQHPLAKIFKLDDEYLVKQGRKATKRLIKEAEARGDFSEATQRQASAEGVQEAQRIQSIEVNKTVTAIQEANNRSGQIIYHPHTVIGNSSRLLISSHELNYQSNRAVRYMLGNPRPSIINMDQPNDTVHIAFKAIVMRSLSDLAGKVMPVTINGKVSVLVEEFDTPAIYNEYVRMGNEVLQAMSTGDYTKLSPETLDKILHDEDEAFFVIDALTNIARYDAAKRGGDKQFTAYTTAEFDGIQNGAIIQAYQLGLSEVMGKGGLIYKDPANVLPEGDLRDHVVSFATRELADLVKDVPEDADTFQGIIDFLVEKSKKKFIKLPIMTTIYGKGASGHGDSAQDMYDSWSNDPNQDVIDPAAIDEAQFVKDLRAYYALVLQSSIGEMLEHAEIQKISTRMFIAFNRVPQVVGANGYIVQSGTRGLVETGEQVKLTLPFESKATGKKPQMTVTMREAVPSVTETGRNEYDKYNVGQQTINQSAVNGTQNIDASVMQHAIVVGKQKLGDNFWMQQVFDAVILDANTLDVMLKQINASFKEVNEQYQMVEAEYQAMQDLKIAVRDEVQRKKKEGTSFDVGKEGEYAGLLHMYAELFQHYKKFTDKDPKVESKKAMKEVSAILGRNQFDIFQWAGDIEEGRMGYVPRLDNLEITPDQYFKAFALLAEKLEIKDRWASFRTKVDKQRKAAHPLVDISGQYV